MPKEKIAYIINHISFFDSHISPIASSAKKKYDIKLFCGNSASKVMDDNASKNLKKKKIKFEKFNFNPTGTNPFREIIGFVSLFNSIIKYNPDLIHCATPKGIIYGGIIARILNIRALVVFNTGMGFFFTSKLNFLEKLNLKLFIKIKHFVMKHKNKKIIVENKYDLNFLKKKYFLKYQDFILILAGSGVDLKKYKKVDIKRNKKVLMPSRVLKEKGVIEFIKASEILKKKYPDWSFEIAGSTDYNKNTNLTKEELDLHKKNGIVKFLGFQKDMIEVYKTCSIVCLPSYREGLSKSLLESASLGIPAVTTDVVGCKDAIIPRKTGELCKVRNIKSLKNKLEILIKDSKKRLYYGKNARKLAENKYGLDKVINKNITNYDMLLNNE